MIKINDLQKKIIKILTMISLVMISSFFLFTNKIKAEELSDFCEYTSPCLSTENISTLTTSENYLVVIGDGYPTTEKRLTVINIDITDYENNKFNIRYYNDQQIYFDHQNSRSSPLTGKYIQSTSIIDLNSTSNSIYASKSSSGFNVLSYSTNIYAYYSTVDLYDTEGNLVFEAGFHNKEEEQDFIINEENKSFTHYGRKFNLHDTGIENYVSNVNYQTIDKIFYDKYGHYLEDDENIDSFFFSYNSTQERYYLTFFDSKDLYKNRNDSWVYLYFQYFINSYNQVYNDMYLGFTYISSDLEIGRVVYFEKDLNNFISFDTWTTVTGNSGIHDDLYDSNTDVDIYYYTNANIPIVKDDEIVGYTIPNAEYVAPTPTSYEFNEDIDVTDISKIKIKFELPEDTKNLGLELDFSIKGLTENVGTIGAPYVSLTSKDENNYDQVDIIDFDYGVSERANLISNMCDIVDCWDTFDSTKYSATFETCIDNLEKIDFVDINKPRLIKEELSNWYTDEYVDKLYDSALILVNRTYILNTSYSNKLYMSLLPDSTTYKYSLEIDTINYQGTLNLNFISNLNYNIEYDYVVDNESYYVTINMKDYAALVLVPKVYYSDTNTSASFLSDMYLYGIYDIELWEDLESKNVLKRYNNYNTNIFSHYFHRLYNSSVLYFVNKDIGNDDYYIKFDSRYYNYVLKNNLFEEVTIINPNTGENMIIPDISDLYDYGSSNDVSFTLDSFLKPIKFIFESITDFYNNYCPRIVQYFFYIIFTFFVVLMLIKIFL